jgi:hypothetical protein
MWISMVAVFSRTWEIIAKCANLTRIVVLATDLRIFIESSGCFNQNWANQPIVYYAAIQMVILSICDELTLVACKFSRIVKSQSKTPSMIMTHRNVAVGAAGAAPLSTC